MADLKLKMNEYWYEIRYVKGDRSLIANSLSRILSWYNGIDEESRPEFSSTESIKYLPMNRNLDDDDESSSAYLAFLASVEDSLEADSDALDKMAETG